MSPPLHTWLGAWGLIALLRTPAKRIHPQSLPPGQLAMLEHMRAVSAVGSPATVSAAIEQFAERTGADEIIVSGATFDPAARQRSLELTMQALA